MVADDKYIAAHFIITGLWNPSAHSQEKKIHQILMQRKKNIRLIGLLIVLIAITSVVYNIGNETSGLDLDKRQFTIDPQAEITDVIVTGLSGDIKNEFSYQSGSWILNSRYKLDQNMRDVFFSVLSQMEIRRPVSESNSDSIAAFLQHSGYQVEIFDNSDLLKTYIIGGNADEVRTFVKGEDNIPFEVHIPGYQSYVAGIFDVPENDWRNRFIFEINPISLSSVTINIEGAEPYDIIYTDNQLTIEGVAADSARLARHMERIVFLQADRYVSLSREPVYDSLVKSNSRYATITISDITGRKQSLILFNKLENDPFILGVGRDNSAALFKFDRIKAIFKSKDTF
jgi:hypothetical protein